MIKLRASRSKAPRYLLLTECSMGDNIVAANPDKEMLRLCSVRCPHMNEITLEDTRDSLQLHALARSTCPRRSACARCAPSSACWPSGRRSIERADPQRRPGRRLRHRRRHGGARARRGRARRRSSSRARERAEESNTSRRRAASSTAAPATRPTCWRATSSAPAPASATRRPSTSLAQQGPELVQSHPDRPAAGAVRPHRRRRASRSAREGGHSLPRIVHAADATGRAIENALIAELRRHPRVRSSRATPRSTC